MHLTCTNMPKESLEKALDEVNRSPSAQGFQSCLWQILKCTLLACAAPHCMVSESLSEDVQCVGQAKAAGIQNILALRGDPPKGEQSFTAVEGGFSCALDLVKYIRRVPREGCAMQAMAAVQSRLALAWQKQPQQKRPVNDSG